MESWRGLGKCVEFASLFEAGRGRCLEYKCLLFYPLIDFLPEIHRQIAQLKDYSYIHKIVKPPLLPRIKGEEEREESGGSVKEERFLQMGSPSLDLDREGSLRTSEKNAAQVCGGQREQDLRRGSVPASTSHHETLVHLAAGDKVGH